VCKNRKNTSQQAGSRGSGFSRQKVDSLLEPLDEHLPSARYEWEHVLQQHELRYPGQKRTVDSIKRKFTPIHRRKVPTGDPTIPLDVDLAKKIRYQMTERADIGEAEVESDDNLCIFESEEDVDATNPTDDGQNNDITEPDGTKIRENTPSSSLVGLARPSVRKKMKEIARGAASEIMELYKLQMIQNQTRREDEKEQRDTDRQELKMWREKQRADRS